MESKKLTDDFKLNELPNGFSATIKKIDHQDFFRQHLSRLCLYEGSRVIARDSRRKKSIRSYEIASTIIAIRNSDAKKITITNIDREE